MELCEDGVEMCDEGEGVGLFDEEGEEWDWDEEGGVALCDKGIQLCGEEKEVGLCD